MRKIERISISAADHERLERLVRDRNTPQKVVWRARIVLLASDGLTAEGIAAGVGKSLLTVRAGTMTHDDKRNGTTTLFAALSMLDGRVIGACMPRHCEFVRFLKLIDQQTPAGLDLHAIVDNDATHQTPAVKRWIKSHPRFFTPTSASWLNMVERFFAEITRRRIRCGAFTSVAELKSATIEYLEKRNANPKPFIWTKSAGQILEKVARAKQALESVH